MSASKFPGYNNGFSLIEMAIVLVIIGLLVGAMVMPLSTQVEYQRYRSTQQKLDVIRNAIVAFAAINKRLPCPDTNGDGQEDGPTCNNVEGELPWATLGMERFDAWGRPYRYRADNNFIATVANPPDTTSGLLVQDRSGNDLTIANPNAPVAIIFSCGKDGKPSGANDADGSTNTDAACTNAGTPDTTYVQDLPQQGQFDDVLIWISKNTLLSQMISSGQWP